MILFTRTAIGEKDFADWGWRIPFLVSVLLLGISVWIRLRLNESPIFQKMKEEGKGSKAPLTEAFANWSNAKLVILALVGGVMGQGVVWYTGQFYALFFLQSILKVDGYSANLLIAWSLLFGTLFFVFFGWLSDKIGRKIIIMAGCLLAVLTYFTVFPAMLKYANPALAAAQAKATVTVTADPSTCSFQGSPIAREIDFRTSCDIAKRTMAQSFVPYVNAKAAPGAPAVVKIGDKEITAPVAKLNDKGDGFDKDSAAAIAAFKKDVAAAVGANNLSIKADDKAMNTPMVLAILVYLVILVTMVYGPIAAMLVEMFPTRIRYTSMSLPYHIGNGWFGGLLPTTAFAMVAATGDIYYGLWYPVIVAAMTFVIGMLFVRETKDVDIYAKD